MTGVFRSYSKDMRIAMNQDQNENSSSEGHGLVLPGFTVLGRIGRRVNQLIILTRDS